MSVVQNMQNNVNLSHLIVLYVAVRMVDKVLT